MTLPIFETPRLLLRPRTLADTDACLAMDGDPAVIRFVSGPWSDPLAHRAFIETRTLGPYPPGLGYWTICHRNAATRFIGWVLLIPADGTRPEIEIGWRLTKSAWRQGFATEAARPLLPHAFATLHLPELIAEIHPDNAASQRVATKLGFRHRRLVPNQGEQLVLYSMTNTDFHAGGH